MYSLHLSENFSDDGQVSDVSVISSPGQSHNILLAPTFFSSFSLFNVFLVVSRMLCQGVM